MTSFRIEWIDECTYNAGSLNGPGTPAGTTIPAAPTTFTYRCELRVAGNKSYYSKKGKMYIDEKDGTFERTFLSSCDGVFWKNLWVSQASYPIGYIAKGKSNSDLFFLSLWPIMASLRGETLLNKKDYFDLNLFETHKAADGVAWLLQQKKGMETTRFWVESGPAFHPRKIAEDRNGLVAYQMTLSYSDASPSYLSEWTFVMNFSDSNKVSQSSRCTVLGVEVNPFMNDNDFTIEFPEGTWLTDQDTDSGYIVRPDNARRLITIEEIRRGAEYDDLLATESGRAKLSGARVGNIIGIVGAIAVLSILCWRFYRRRMSAIHG